MDEGIHRYLRIKVGACISWDTSPNFDLMVKIRQRGNGMNDGPSSRTLARSRLFFGIQGKLPSGRIPDTVACRDSR
ncbi:MAG: hypothetical protein WBD93_06540, partial [Acidobacteriaceae bacterium]